MSFGPPTPRPALPMGESIVLGMVVALAGLLAIGFVVTYPRCIGCPSSTTPLGASLDIGNGTGACIAGNGSSPRDCADSFSIRVYPAGVPPNTIPSPLDLSFRLLNSVSLPLNSTFSIVLTNPGGSWLGTWNSSTSNWGIPTGGGTCGASDCLSTPLAAGDALLLHSVPAGGLPYSHLGDQLMAVAVAGGFSGSIVAPIN